MARTSPLPYTGHRLDRQRRTGERWSELPGRIEVTEGRPAADGAGAAPGLARYDYNELGFRGPSFEGDARWTAFIFGESDAFGAEVEFEEVWAVRVAREVARRRGVAERDVCIMNFADEGASNAHIARMTLSQCGRIRPDLVLVNFAEEARSEGLANGDVFTAGPWLATDAAQAMLQNAPDEDGLRARLEERMARGRAFLRFCTKPQGLLDALHDMLLVQNTLAAWSVDGVAISRRTKRVFHRDTMRDHVLGPLVRQLDPDFLARFRPTKLRWRNDWSSDGHHYGPRTHAAVAQRVLVHLERHSPDIFGPGAGLDAPLAPLPRSQRKTRAIRRRTSAAALRSRHA